MKGEIQGYIDVAQMTLYLFWIFFASLIFYLRREDRREGYPLFSEPSNTYKRDDFLFIPPPKTFKLANGSTVQAPDGKPDDRPIKAQKIDVWPGAPLVPIGDPMQAAVGPGSYAERKNVPDDMHGKPKIAPLRAAPGFGVDRRDPDPRGMAVKGADGATAGTVTDVWVDRMEMLIRYLEIELTGSKKHVLVPMTFVRIDKGRRTANVKAILGSQFDGVPALASPDQVTLLEEDKITAYYGGGTLYATPQRAEPLL